MSPSRLPGAGALALLVACQALISCAPSAEEGWTRLWRASWERVELGELWLHGVAAGPPRTFATERPVRFRARLGNPGREVRRVVLRAGAGRESWSLAPGEDLAVDVALEAGSYRLEAEPGVVVGEPRIGSPVESPRLLVLALADTLRADHVTADLTPGILAAFADGRRWTDATANAPWTLPSVASLFTSRTVLGLSLPDGDLVAVPRNLESLAERLESAGFATGAAVANYSVHVANGFAEGFGSYRVPSPDAKTKQRDVSWVVAEGRRFLESHRGEDAFLYLHLMDTHEPFRDHGRGLPRPPRIGPLGLRDRRATPEERELLRELYRGEVEHLDRGLAPFLAELPAEATVAFVADHGEALGEHEVWGHALTLYQEVVAVPLLVRGPGVEAGEVARPVQLLDLAPTLLEAVGVTPAPGMAGRSLLSEPPGSGPRQPIVMATYAAGPLRWALRDGRRKLVWRGAPQPDGAAGATEMRESTPLPRGAFAFTIPGTEERPAALSADLARATARGFAHSAGKMVPGVTLLVVGARGPVELSWTATGELEPVQVWGVEEVTVEERGSRWSLRTEEAHPWLGVAFRAEGDVRIEPGPGSVEWPGLPPGEAWLAGSDDGTVPAFERAGVYLWWNQDRALEISGQEEAIERLRALGYL